MQTHQVLKIMTIHLNFLDTSIYLSCMYLLESIQSKLTSVQVRSLDNICKNTENTAYTLILFCNSVINTANLSHYDMHFSVGLVCQM